MLGFLGGLFFGSLLFGDNCDCDCKKEPIEWRPKTDADIENEKLFMKEMDKMLYTCGVILVIFSIIVFVLVPLAYPLHSYDEIKTNLSGEQNVNSFTDRSK